MADSALAPCPLCGERAEIRQTRSKVWPMLAVQCTNQDCLALVEGYTEAEVTARWHRRPPPSPAPLAGELDDLISRCRRYGDHWGGVDVDDVARTLREAAAALQPAPAPSDGEMAGLLNHLQLAARGIGPFAEKGETTSGLFGKAAEALAALLRSTPQAGGEWRPTHRHYKGGLYRKLHDATDEGMDRPVTVYESQDGRCWVRPTEDFEAMLNIGVLRFEPLSAAPSPREEKDNG